MNRLVVVPCVLWMTVASVLPAQEPLAVGRPAPALDFEVLIAAPEGTVVSLEKLRGQVVVLEFWATWCAPCLAAFPHINALAAEFEGEPVRFIAVSDENEGKVRPCLAKHAIKTWVGLDTDLSVHKAYGVQAIPYTVVVGKDGIVAAMTVPSQLTSEKLRGYLAGRRDPAPEPATRPSASAAESKPLFQITVREVARAGGWAMGTGSLEFRGTELGEALAMLHGLPSKAWVTGPADLLGKRIAVKANVPSEAKGRLREMTADAVGTAFRFTTRLEEREMAVVVVTAPAGPGKDLRRAEGSGMGHASDDVGILVAANADLRSLLHELELRLGQPLVDETGLTGTFDWDLRYEDGHKDALIAAMKEQLGLVATPARRTIKVLAVTLAADKDGQAR